MAAIQVQPRPQTRLKLKAMIRRAIIRVPYPVWKWPFSSIHRENERNSCYKEKAHNPLYVNIGSMKYYAKIICMIFAFIKLGLHAVWPDEL
jgi:hypothetical protein